MTWYSVTSCTGVCDSIVCLLVCLQVIWQRTAYDKNGRETTLLISTDMDTKDNNKWSIEKPTLQSWRSVHVTCRDVITTINNSHPPMRLLFVCRLRIKALAIQDEGNYTCYVQITDNNRVESNRTVFSYGETM